MNSDARLNVFSCEIKGLFNQDCPPIPNPIKDLAISWVGSALARHDPPTAAQRVSLMTIEARMAAGNGSRRCYVVPKGGG